MEEHLRQQEMCLIHERFIELFSRKEQEVAELKAMLRVQQEEERRVRIALLSLLAERQERRLANGRNGLPVAEHLEPLPELSDFERACLPNSKASYQYQPHNLTTEQT